MSSEIELVDPALASAEQLNATYPFPLAFLKEEPPPGLQFALVLLGGGAPNVQIF